ncbi:hypothetical protein FRACA_2280007 [Frankia canadensis]|uniref:Uncharacterized protein n=1 Tax=Frankia canadensis TaxID=1836972 RepID=A0A2I2KR99_9ACTN|nr:hypothetical protein FRACA_2280007 [Frankia canadensis]SOU55485.1 hypothetical protein FRACA_2280007 [Frankia canadensis]
MTWPTLPWYRRVVRSSFEPPLLPLLSLPQAEARRAATARVAVVVSSFDFCRILRCIVVCPLGCSDFWR